ncbi:FAD-dependent oxidoreductase [Candidatus Aerophobetes bacterium]|nr:FAD-dependent oxidoreductase [Candidatus Aerophobetes bacterium]
MQKLEKLFEPIYIGKLKLKNRIVMVPTDTSSASAYGEVTERMLLFHEQVAKGGTGFIIVGASTPDSATGKPTVTATVVDDDSFIPSLNELAEVMKENGAKCAVQIQHPGRQAATPPFAQVAPSDIVTQQPGSAGHERVYGGRRMYKIARALTIEEIYDLIEKFSEAAWRVQQAGFDAVELHGAHGYLIAQFMSPATNQRTDRFGGSLVNRMRFPLEIIARIKEKCGEDFPVLVRYSADEFVPGGRGIEESKKVARMFQDAGVAALDISAGTFDSPWPCMDPIYYPEGWRVYLAEEIKKVVDIPVITAGTIRDPRFAERVLREGRADLIGLSRQFLADPEWAKKAREGRFDDIRKCISCLVGCWQESLLAKTRCRCAINPVMGNEKKFLYLKKAEKSREVMIIGGGPGGMEAARVCALRGHKVTLFEKEDELGGQLRLCCMVPGKEKIRWILDWLRIQIDKLGVEVHLEEEIVPETVKSLNPEVVIVATGAGVLNPDIPGIVEEKTLPFTDVLRCTRRSCKWWPRKREVREVDVGEKVVVWGGGFAAADTAELLASRGKKVTVITEFPEFLPDMEPITRETQIFRLTGREVPGLKNKPYKYKVEILTGLKVTKRVKEGVVVMDKNWEERIIPADSLIIAIRNTEEMDAEGSLAHSLRNIVPEMYLIGDCTEITTPGGHFNIKNAIYHGHRVGHLI